MRIIYLCPLTTPSPSASRDPAITSEMEPAACVPCAMACLRGRKNYAMLELEVFSLQSSVTICSYQGPHELRPPPSMETPGQS